MIASDGNLLFYEFEGHIRDKLAAFLAARPEANKAYIFNTVTQFNHPRSVIIVPDGLNSFDAVKII